MVPGAVPQAIAPGQLQPPVQLVPPAPATPQPQGMFAAIVPGQAKPNMPIPMGAPPMVMQMPGQPAAQAPPAQRQSADDILDLGGAASGGAGAPKPSGDLLDDLLGGPAPAAQGAQAQDRAEQSLSAQPRPLFVDDNVSFVMKAAGTATRAECQFMIAGIGKQDVKVRAQYAVPGGV